MIGAWVGGVALGAAVGYYGVPRIPRALQKRALRRRCRERGSIVLSYDDGPGPQLTPRVLDLLADRGVRASFFVLGKPARLAPELVVRMHDEGHEVGSHSESHLHAWKCSPWRVVRDIEAGFATLAKLLPGTRPFRPPYGKTTLVSWRYIARSGVPVVWWTHDSGDTWRQRPSAARFVDGVLAAGGGVVLLHDADYGGQERADYVLDVTARLIAAAPRAGLRIERFADLGLGSGAVAGTPPAGPARAAGA